MPHPLHSKRRANRRTFLAGAAALGGAVLAGRRYPLWAQTAAPGVITSDKMRPGIAHGVQSGDVVADRAIVWSRTDRPARMIVDYSTAESFRDARRIVGPAALADSDFTARVDLTNLPGGQDILYHVQFQDLSELNAPSEPASGRFQTAPMGRRTVSFCF